MQLSDLKAVTDLHHAYITDATQADVLAVLASRGVSVHGNPDVLTFTIGELAVDDARQISTYAQLKSVSGAKYFIVVFSRAGVEAQNALLKVVEEAPGNTHFFFCTQNTGALLPTLRSRCIAVSAEYRVESSEREEASEFLTLSYAERLSKIEKLVTAAQRSGDRTHVRAFARALVEVAPRRETLDAARYLEQNGSSPKLILSHLAVSLPSSL
jgi:hypothetical protein